MKNIFDTQNLDLKEEFFETLAKSCDLKIERIVSNFHSSKDGFWYDQSDDEFVCLLKGEAQLEFKGESEIANLKSGDWLLIKAHRLHRVKSTSKNCVWLAVFAKFDA